MMSEANMAQIYISLTNRVENLKTCTYVNLLNCALSYDITNPD